MTTGSTIIAHNHPLPIQVENIFAWNLNYNMAMEQMIALTLNSADCYQTFELQVKMACSHVKM